MKGPSATWTCSRSSIFARGAFCSDVDRFDVSIGVRDRLISWVAFVVLSHLAVLNNKLGFMIGFIRDLTMGRLAGG
jgi:hypothetical protein